VLLADIVLGEKNLYPKYKEKLKYPEPPKETVVISAEKQLVYKKVRAHRFYQFAICLYKELKYNPHKYESSEGSEASNSLFLINKGQISDDLIQIDKILREAIQRYCELTVPGTHNDMIFPDYIIRLTLCRAYVNFLNRKFVTADKLLEFAEEMLKSVKKNDSNYCQILVD